MKKFALLLSLAGLFMIPMQAQITLLPHGQSVFGKRMTMPFPPKSPNASVEKVRY